MKQPFKEHDALGVSPDEAERVAKALSSLQRSDHERGELAVERFLRVNPRLPVSSASRNIVSSSRRSFYFRHPFASAACVALVLVAGLFAFRFEIDSESSREARVSANDLTRDIDFQEPAVEKVTLLAKLIEKADAGDTIILESKVYEGSLTISKAVRIVARGGNVRIVGSAAAIE